MEDLGLRVVGDRCTGEGSVGGFSVLIVPFWWRKEYETWCQEARFNTIGAVVATFYTNSYSPGSAC